MDKAGLHIAVVGIINHDTISMADGRRLEDLGGILYNTAVLANLVDESVILHPVSRIGADCQDLLHAILAPYDNVDTSGIAVAPEGTSRNTIRYDDRLEKIEQLTNHIDPITFAQVEPYLTCDALLVNFIIGDDISRSVLSRVRSRTDALLYMDVHNLCLGIDEDGFRFHRPPADWQEWMGLVDVVQMNEIEAGLLAGGDLESNEDFVEMGRQVLGLGPGVFIATRGRQGAVTVYRQDGSIRTLISPPESVKDLVDTTGCGDAFAAGFLKDFVVSGDPESAARMGSWTARVNCTLAGLAEVKRFRTLSKNLPELG